MFDRDFWRDVRKRVVATVIGTIIVGIGTKLLGWWPAIWATVLGALKDVWSVLAYSVPFPLSVVLALALAVTLAVRLWIKAATRARENWDAAMAALAQRSSRPATPQFQPNELQQQILQGLARLDGHSIFPSTLHESLRVGKLIFDQALDGLSAENLIQYRRVSGADAILLSPKGRDFVIAAGYAIGKY